MIRIGKEVNQTVNTQKKGDLLGLEYSLAVRKGIIALYGAGGKTTLLERLSRELAGRGEKVLMTTTTKIFRPSGIPVVLSNDLGEIMTTLREKFRHYNLVALGCPLLTGDKFRGIEPEWAKIFLEEGLASYIIVEADGAARKPIKGYASFEPVLPREANLIIPILGLDALGKALEENNVHRPEIFAQATGAPPGEPLTPFYFCRSLLQMIDRGRSQSPHARILPLINKVDFPPESSLVQAMAEEMANSSLIDRIYFTALREKNPIKYVLAFSPAAPAVFVSYEEYLHGIF